MMMKVRALDIGLTLNTNRSCVDCVCSKIERKRALFASLKVSGAGGSKTCCHGIDDGGGSSCE